MKNLWLLAAILCIADGALLGLYGNQYQKSCSDRRAGRKSKQAMRIRW